MAEIKTANLSDLLQDPENANKGTPRGNKLLKQSLREGLAGRSLLAAADLTVLAGNKTLAAAQELGMKEAVFVETEGEALIVHVRKDIANSKTKRARKLALADNRVAELNLNWDNQLLGAMAKFERDTLELLWDEDEIDRKVGIASYLKNLQDNKNGSTVENPLEEWEGMPEFESDDKTAFQAIHVHFKNQKDIDRFADLIDQKITSKTRSIWFPEIEIERYADKRYSHES